MTYITYGAEKELIRKVVDQYITKTGDGRRKYLWKSKYLVYRKGHKNRGVVKFFVFDKEKNSKYIVYLGIPETGERQWIIVSENSKIKNK